MPLVLDQIYVSGYLLFANIKSAVTVNGQLSQWFYIQGGCRQGDPISHICLVFHVDILAIMIRQNKNIICISIGETEHQIWQYADDTEIMLEGDNNSFKTTIKTIDVFAKMSGLFLNAGKTSAICLGSTRNSHVRYMPHFHMELIPRKFKILGT